MCFTVGLVIDGQNFRKQCGFHSLLKVNGKKKFDQTATVQSGSVAQWWRRSERRCGFATSVSVQRI